ncbi:hypothetical protein [Paracoccus spongiarum]|uniref:Uncharacterized protein n=1 Tax=Paracoccus spongiarum TaxID=3064387 RepID=A0ABT9J8V1_9RHOB|nr:hypothetical protein [Paracoccus sp. 2205BS29-5]MDP5306237.1 hypothetical protein [Paracoccus sp. 2205BS29-5]
MDGTYLFGATLLYKINASATARMRGRLVLNGATEIRGSFGEISATHVSRHRHLAADHGAADGGRYRRAARVFPRSGWVFRGRPNVPLGLQGRLTHPSRSPKDINMTDRNSLAQEVGAAFRDHGLTAAITALIGGTTALLASVARKAFTNDAMLARLDRELLAERARVERQRAEDRKTDAERLARIEADIRAMRALMFEAFQRGGKE